MNSADMPGAGDLEGQLQKLGAEREYLESELGVSDARELVAMVRSLEEQLVDLYQQKEEEPS